MLTSNRWSAQTASFWSQEDGRSSHESSNSSCMEAQKRPRGNTRQKKVWSCIGLKKILDPLKQKWNIYWGHQKLRKKQKIHGVGCFISFHSDLVVSSPCVFRTPPRNKRPSPWKLSAWHWTWILAAAAAAAAAARGPSFSGFLLWKFTIYRYPWYFSNKHGILNNLPLVKSSIDWLCSVIFIIHVCLPDGRCHLWLQLTAIEYP